MILSPNLPSGYHHAAGAISGAFMLRKGRYKYIYYVGFDAQLFDLEQDPEELEDLAQHPEMEELLVAFEAELRTICDPEEVDGRAKTDQEKLVKENGAGIISLPRAVLGQHQPQKNLPNSGADLTEKVFVLHKYLLRYKRPSASQPAGALCFMLDTTK